MPTIRKEIAELLEKGSLDLREISQTLRIREKEALDHLQHIARSVHPRKLAMDPAVCLQCGFSFKKRERFSTPRRCPICKSESISPPRYQITG
ncbi:MAG: domain/Zn-ribbon transcriptional regulator [Deltaproteobacteria bacterium]|nr:domain/Zn-ribbon transcriptional regulator [Deltaproteobacteria bacterium]